jgi:Tol biopolymer transport system component
MTVAAGSRLGSYVIVDRLGAGGMGEVYRAHDTTLNREVALKVLPEVFRLDPDRLARFKREAQVLASVNHPNIAAIYGFEESSGTQALVLELVEGPTLADRIAQGRLTVSETVSIARQVADALEAAHERGIIHRDLKPANIKLRSDGTVKVLDFGLAKALDPASSPGAPVTSSLTMTSPAMTQAGVILGTAAYMSPEQARGAPVDKRTDVWAFGCVLFEMLAGQPVFGRTDTVSDAIAAILKSEPAWSALPHDVPSGVRALLRRCLEKDPRRRLRDIADAGLLITDGLTAADETGAPAARSASSQAVRWAAISGWVIAALVLLGGAAAIGRWSGRTAVEPAPAIRLTLPLATPLEAAGSATTRHITLSPDGTRVVYVGRQNDTPSLYLQDLRTGDVKRLADTTDADAPLFSPDGLSIGFTVGNRLKSVRLDGGLPRDVGDVQDPQFGWVWSTSDETVFGGDTGLSRLSGTGVQRQPEILAKVGPDDALFSTPFPLPGGAFLVSVRGKGATRRDDASQIAVVSPHTGDRRIVIQKGSSPVYVRRADGSGSHGYIVYADAGRLLAAPFDLRQLTVTAAAVPVIDSVDMRPNGDAAQYSVSANGTVVYAEGVQSELVWVDRGGAARPLSATLRRYALPRLSPDGRSVAMEIQDSPHQVWLLDVDRDVLAPLTNWRGGGHNFAWAPDGRSIVFTASDGGNTHLAWLRIDGSHEATTLVTPPDSSPWAESWSRDGRWLAARLRGKSASEQLLALLPIAGATPPTVAGEPRLNIPGGTSASFSPDGDWIAYCDCASAPTTPHVFVSRVSDGVRHQVADGASEPLWGTSGRELYFRSGSKMMVVDVAMTAAGVQIGRPRTLFEGDYMTWGDGDYDVSRDGQRFVMVRRSNARASTLTVRLNWPSDLDRYVPNKN